MRLAIRLSALALAPACLLLSQAAMAQESGAPKAPPIVHVSPPAPTALATVTPTAQSSASALDLAILLNSEAVTHKQLDKAYRETLPKLMAQNPSISVLEEKYPGVIATAVQSERDVVEPFTMSILPGLQKTVAAQIESHLTAGEIGELLAFYRSPAGTKVIDSVAEGTDVSKIAKKNFEDDGAQLTASDLRQATSEAATPLIFASLSADELQKVLQFVASPVGQKWSLLQKQILSDVADYQNNYRDSVKVEAQQRVATAVSEFIAKSQASAPAAAREQ